MSRRGMTMIELLLALALLAMVVRAAASWTHAAADMSRAAEPAQREALVQSVLVRIGEDLVTGDFDTQEDRSNNSAATPPRVRAGDEQSGETLEIDLRRGISHIYRLERAADSTSARLVRVEDHQSESITRMLLDDVAGFHCAIDEEQRLLTVTIEILPQRRGDGGDAQVFTRRYRL